MDINNFKSKIKKLCADILGRNDLVTGTTRPSLDELPTNYQEDLKDSAIIRVSTNSNPSKPQDLTENPEFISLFIKAKNTSGIAGSLVMDYFNNLDIKLTPNGVFECIDSEEKVIFSVANCYEPGLFSYDLLSELNYHGFMFYLIVQDSELDLENFDILLRTARDFALRFNLEIQDHNHRPLTQTQLIKYKEKIKTAIAVEV